MANTITPPTCPHCGHAEKDDRWKQDSAWEFSRPVGETCCGKCGQRIKLIRDGDTLRAFASWPELEAAWAAKSAEGGK